MREVNIGPASDFEDPGRKVIDAQGLEVGVFKLGGEFFAYANHCPHMGGPACQGKIMPKVEEVIAEDRTSKGQAFSKTQINIVCPWHGFEFDMRTGIHPGNPKMRLRPIKVHVSTDGDVIVALPDARNALRRKHSFARQNRGAKARRSSSAATGRNSPLAWSSTDKVPVATPK